MGCEPDNLTGYVPLPENKALFESVWQAAVPTEKGLNLMQMMDAAAQGRFKALWAIGYDVLLTNANAASHPTGACVYGARDRSGHVPERDGARLRHGLLAGGFFL